MSFFKGHHELCDYCPSEFRNEEEGDADEVDDGFKRHHRHHQDHQLAHVKQSTDDSPPDSKKITKTSGEYDFEQSKSLKMANSHHSHHTHNNKYKETEDAYEPIQSTSNLLTGDLDIDSDPANYGEYKYDKMTVEENG